MAQRGLLVRLTMFMLPLRMAVETAPVTARMPPDILEFQPHRQLQHRPLPSVRNFFKRTIDQTDVEISTGRKESSVEVEASFNCSSELAETGDHKTLLFDLTSSPSLSSSSSTSTITSSRPLTSSPATLSLTNPFSDYSDSSSPSYSSVSSSSYYQTSSPGLLLRDLQQPRTQSDPSEVGARRALSQAMIRCPTKTANSEDSQDTKKQNLTITKKVFENRSLKLDKEGVKVTPIGETGGDIGEGGAGPGDTLPFRCSYKSQAPPAWSPVIKDQSLLCVVNPHWLTYSPPSHLHFVIIASLYLLIMFIGLVGNSLVILLFMSSRALRTPSNLFILNLAVSDFLLVAMISAAVHNSLQEGPALGRVGCDLYGFIGGLSGTTSIMTLAAISFDRYLVISYPLDPFKKLSDRQVLAIILVTWLYAFTFSIIPLVGFTNINYSPEGFLTTCSFDYLSESTNTRIYIFAFFVAAWVLPLNIIVFSYMSIVSTVSKQERYCRTCQGTFASSFKHQRLKRKEGVELKLMKVASGIIALWVLAWTPYSVVALLGIFRQRAVITPLVSMLPAIFCKTAACFDPFIYALSHPRFKAELTNRFIRRRHFLGGMLSGVPQGFSVSTFSEIREERELSDVQPCNYDPSTSSLGPLLQRKTSSSSNPTLDRNRRRDTGGSPGSKSLVSPVSTEIYPRKSLSTYSFRSISKNSRLDEKIEAVHKSRRADKYHLELRTRALIELPAAPLPQPTRSFSCSFSTGLERVNLCAQPPSHPWSNNKMPTAVKDQTYSNGNHLPVQIESPSRKAKTCVKNHAGLPASALSCRTKERSNSLPNMIHGPNDRKPEGKFSKNVLLQIFQGKILPGVRWNKSSSSIFHNDGKV